MYFTHINNSILKLRHLAILKKPLKNLHTECLRDRIIYKVTGKEAKDFLQGLLTNDIHHLNDESLAMYSLFLNVKGRVLFDTIVTRKNDEEYLLEVDNTLFHHFSMHLRIYKVRRTIDIIRLPNFKIWTIYNNLEGSVDKNMCEIKNLPDKSILFTDPRLKELGQRAYVDEESDLTTNSFLENTEGYYKILRHKLGVVEGAQEFNSGKSLPLELNADYLHGVSFHKGCYIGQELTARTFHTGVVRKRVMPLTFSKKIGSIGKDNNVTDENGKSIGRILGTSGLQGIGLMRIDECLSASSLRFGEASVKTFKPSWWPVQSPKLTN